MTTSERSRHDELRAGLSSALMSLHTPSALVDIDVIVSHCEVNDRHGTGLLIRHIFSRGAELLSIRSHDIYDGRQDFGASAMRITHASPERSQVAATVVSALNGVRPRRLLSIPYFRDDVLSTIALHDLFHVPVGTYILDDQNVLVSAIPDEEMGELLRKSTVRFGVSRELCTAYEQKYGLPFFFLPPVVPTRLIQAEPTIPEALDSSPGVLFGNVWSQLWLDRLRVVTRESGFRLDWYGNPRRDWLTFQDSELEADGITPRGFPPDDQLVTLLRNCPFVVLLTGATDTPDDRPELTRLSLPSRLTFATATANVPVIVLGRPDSAVARFVDSFGIGIASGYDASSFRDAVRRVRKRDVQAAMRRRAANIAPSLAAEGVSGWIWASITEGRPPDARFESLMPGASPASQILPSRDVIATSRPRSALVAADLVITPNEVNNRHGTGALVRRLFPADHGIISVRSYDHYGAQHAFGEIQLRLGQRGQSRQNVFRSVFTVLSGHSVKRIFCVPYFTDDLLTAIAAKEIYGVPLAAYIMDDQNIRVPNIPDSLMREFLARCSLRLATHPELRDAYEHKYHEKFWLLPAVAPDRLILTTGAVPGGAPKNTDGALLGSIWSEAWFAMLESALRGSGARLDWYGNPNCEWLTDGPRRLTAAGITSRGLLPEDELALRLRQHRFVVVPTGTLDERDDRQEISSLSLPGRIIFALATANTPIVILGSPKTPAARFVKRFGIGVVSDYETSGLRHAIKTVSEPGTQAEMRRNAASIARDFSDLNIGDWIWRSLEAGQPCDLRFETLMPRSPGDLVAYVEPPVPDDFHHEFVPVYHVMRRLRQQGFSPDFVVDVGASMGIWSFVASKIFPDARFVLVDPLVRRYDPRAREYFLGQIPHAEVLEVALSNRAGTATFRVSEDLYGSSLLDPADFRTYASVAVNVKTLNQVARELSIRGRGIVKLDVQCAEHLILEGGGDFLPQVDAIVAELSLLRYDRDARVFLEMVQLFDELGFRYYDETGMWRSPVDGTLLQREVLFVRQNILLPETSRRLTP